MQYQHYLGIEQACQNSEFLHAAFNPKKRELLNASSALLSREDLLAEFLFLEAELDKPDLNTQRWRQHYSELNRYLRNLDECIDDFPTSRLANQKLSSPNLDFNLEDFSLINHSITIAAGRLNSAFQRSRYVKAKEFQGIDKNLEHGAKLSSNWKVMQAVNEESRLEQKLSTLLGRIEADKIIEPNLREPCDVFRQLIVNRQELASCLDKDNYFNFVDCEIDVDSILHSKRAEGLSYLRQNLANSVSEFYSEYISHIDGNKIKKVDSSNLNYWKLLADLTRKIDLSGELYDHQQKTRAITRIEEDISNDAACRYHYEPEFSVMRYNVKDRFSWTIFVHEFAHAMHNYRRFHSRDVLNISNSVTCNEFVANAFELLTLEGYSTFYPKNQAQNVMLLNIYNTLKHLRSLALYSQFESVLYEDRAQLEMCSFKTLVADFYNKKPHKKKINTSAEMEFKILNDFYDLRDKVGVNWYYLIAQCAAYQFYTKFTKHPEKSLVQLQKFMQIQQPKSLEEMFAICEIEYKSPQMFFKNTFRALSKLGDTLAYI